MYVVLKNVRFFKFFYITFLVFLIKIINTHNLLLWRQCLNNILKVYVSFKNKKKNLFIIFLNFRREIYIYFSKKKTKTL